jgi:hypothetical protein
VSRAMNERVHQLRVGHSSIPRRLTKGVGVRMRKPPHLLLLQHHQHMLAPHCCAELPSRCCAAPAAIASTNNVCWC